MKKSTVFIVTIIILGVTIAFTTAESNSKPSGVTTIYGLDRWDGNVPNIGGNRFIIFKQFNNTCGPTCAEMVFHYYGKWGITQNRIWDNGDIHTVEIGTFPGELRRAFNGLGVPAFYFDKDTKNYGRNPHASLRKYIAASRPPSILLRMGAESYHWVVVVGYDPNNNYLIADPNGEFVWWSKTYLDRMWSFRKTSGPRPVGAFNVTSDDLVRFKADPYTMIVPKKAPTEHFGPMWSEMLAVEVNGDHDWNPFFKTQGWRQSFQFFYPFNYYTLAGIKPATVSSAGGTAQAWISGSSAAPKKGQLDVWGQVEYGKATRGKLWVVVRTFRTN